ncbi:RDD family protein [Halobacillus karajensis]|uniref:RDD family protein n=1 Tax=Halobacillus karajensis TaxID=195088 RepID=A0A024P3Q8_9BACI|nr:RDD family protein [Halobacillus karajensis]CDQ20881.1 RDD family protein [Halobacillus karajensis]CDQ23649.1 RDD family protein [Halobacillus karajensis]CDQ27127.1 RDD family protein [Halobacillus karajensis]
MNASFSLRFKAFIIDYILILIYLVGLFIFSVFLSPFLQKFFTGSVIVAQVTGFLLVTLPVSLYFIISDSNVVEQSFGKRKVGIRVVGNKEEALTMPHATFRTILKFLPWELSHFFVYRLIYIGDGEVPFTQYLLAGLIYVLIFAYILTAVFTRKKQSLYDIVSKTHVVKV